MVPSKVYVGDCASLVLPLSGITDSSAETASGQLLHNSDDIDIHHITVERRPGGNFLTIEFSAYAPGQLELPPIALAGDLFHGLSVEISSILSPDESGTVLSAPALPLAIPGTSFLIYGSISTTVFFMLLAIWVLLRGRKQLEGWLIAWKQRRLLASMMGTERRLNRALLKGVPCRQILDILSAELRDFLSRFTGDNYRAMTAAEIIRFNSSGNALVIPDSEFLGAFFSLCDGMRFSGHDINGNEAMTLLGDVKRFLAMMGKKS